MKQVLSTIALNPSIPEGLTFPTQTAADPPREHNASAILPWLEELSFIPEYLLSRGASTRLSQAIKDVKCELGGGGTLVHVYCLNID